MEMDVPEPQVLQMQQLKSQCALFLMHLLPTITMLHTMDYLTQLQQPHLQDQQSPITTLKPVETL